MKNNIVEKISDKIRLGKRRAARKNGERPEPINELSKKVVGSKKVNSDYLLTDAIQKQLMQMF